MARRRKASKVKVVDHIIPTSEELKTRTEKNIPGTSLRGAGGDGVLFYSDDLSQFAFLPGNRLVRETRVRKIISSMEQWGWIYNQPACVTADGGVVDGQARFTAALKGGYGMFFTVCDPTIPYKEAIKMFNEAQENWSFEDYFSGLMTAHVEPFDKLWYKWKEVDAEYKSSLSPTAFLAAFGISRRHLVDEFLPELYNYEDGMATIREIMTIVEIAPKALANIFKQTKTIDVFRRLRKMVEHGWELECIVNTLSVSQSSEQIQGWRDGLTSSTTLGRRLAFRRIHNWKKQTHKFMPPAEWYDDDYEGES